MANQSPDGVTLERDNSTLLRQGVNSNVSPFSKMFGLQAAGSALLADQFANLRENDNRIQELREKLEKANPFTFSNGNQAAQLNQAGLIAAGAGIGGIATAYDRKEILKREEDERRENVNAAARAIAAAEIGRQLGVAIANVFAKHQKLFDAAHTALESNRANPAMSVEDRADAYVDDIEPALIEAYEEAAKVEGATPEQIAAQVAETTRQEAISNGATSSEASEIEKSTADLLQRAFGAGANANLEVYRGSEVSANLSLNFFGATNSVEGVPDISSKDQALEALNHMNNESAASIASQRENLQSLQSELTALQNDLRLSQNAMRAEGAGGFSSEIQAEMDEQREQLELISQEIERQREVIDLQEEVNAEMQDYARNSLLPQLNDDMSNADVDFLKAAIVNAPPELIEKSQRLAELTGNTGNDPISQLAAMADNPDSNLNDVQRAEIRQFVTDVKQALTNKFEADQLVAQASEIMQNERAMDPDGLGITFNDPTMNRFMAAAMPTGEERMRIALDERDAAIEELNALAGVDSAEANPLVATATESSVQEAPAPAPSFELSADNIVDQTIGGRDTISRAEIEDVLARRMNLSGAKLEETVDAAVQSLEDEGVILVTNEPYEPVYVAGLVGSTPEAANSPQAPQNAPAQPEPEAIRLAQQQYRQDPLQPQSLAM